MFRKILFPFLSFSLTPDIGTIQLTTRITTLLQIQILSSNRCRETITRQLKIPFTKTKNSNSTKSFYILFWKPTKTKKIKLHQQHTSTSPKTITKHQTVNGEQRRDNAWSWEQVKAYGITVFLVVISDSNFPLPFPSNNLCKTETGIRIEKGKISKKNSNDWNQRNERWAMLILHLLLHHREAIASSLSPLLKKWKKP